MDDLDQLADDMDRAGDRMGQEAYDLVRWATERTGLLGRAGANVRTGRMKASITQDYDGGPGSDRIVGETGPTVDYAIYPHNGTSRIRPNPFMDRAADATSPEFYARAEALGGRVLDG